MLSNLTLNSIFWIVLGLGLIGGGAFFAYSKHMYPFAGGVFFLGLGSVLCGLTNGFTDYSRNGRLLWKFGAFFLFIGIVLAVYGGYQYV